MKTSLNKLKFYERLEGSRKLRKSIVGNTTIFNRRVIALCGYTVTDNFFLSKKDIFSEQILRRSQKHRADLIKRLFLTRRDIVALNSYKGYRLKKGLPLRGQRTHTNAQTSRRRNYALA